MDNPAGGIYTKGFQLFSGESLTYRILDEDGKDTGEHGTLTLDREAQGAVPGNGKEEIDRMRDYLAFHDDLAMDEAMVDHERLDERQKSFFI